MKATNNSKEIGNYAVNLIVSKVPGTTIFNRGPSEQRIHGDVNCPIKGLDIECEVKASLSQQVRPKYYHPLIHVDTETDEIFIMSADEVMKEAATLLRGHHCENPFECCSFGYLSKKRRQKYKLIGDLSDAIYNAHLRGENSPQKAKAKIIIERQEKHKEEDRKLVLGC